LSGLLAGIEEHAVRLLAPKIPDENVAQGILHQAVYGDVSQRAQVGPAFLQVAQHAPFELASVSFFSEHGFRSFRAAYPAALAQLALISILLIGNRLGLSRGERHGRIERIPDAAASCISSIMLFTGTPWI
jgi:hypothetical protein